MSSDVDAVTSIMGCIPEVIWHSGIKDVPRQRIYDVLMDCFDFSGLHPAVIPRFRDIAYLSARALVHIGLERRCITQYEEDEEESWKTLCTKHLLLSPTDDVLNSESDSAPDSDLETVLFMVDTMLGHDIEFPWAEYRMEPTPHHLEWMSHVLLYCAWERGRLSEAMTSFIENIMSLEPPNDIVTTNWLFIIGLVIDIPLHVNDITVRDKRWGPDSCRMLSADSSPSREKTPILKKVLEAFSDIFSKSIRMPSALRALQLLTRFRVKDVSIASFELFETIMACDNLTDQDWKAARLAIRGAFLVSCAVIPRYPKEGEGVLKFLHHHFGLQGAGEDHRSSIHFAIDAFLIGSSYHEVLTAEFTSSPSFVRGICSIIRPGGPYMLQRSAVGLIALMADQWFGSPVPIVEPEEIPEFCAHLAQSVVDKCFHGQVAQRWGVTILFGMFHSSEWRKHIVPRFWCTFAYCLQVEEKWEPFRWCLRNAIELLEFTRGLPDGEGLKWWYCTLWFHFDKLDTTVQDEVERIARDMSLSDGLSDLNLYLELIEREVVSKRGEVEGYREDDRLMESCMKRRTQLVTLEGNCHRLARIVGKRQ